MCDIKLGTKIRDFKSGICYTRCAWVYPRVMMLCLAMITSCLDVIYMRAIYIKAQSNWLISKIDKRHIIARASRALSLVGIVCVLRFRLYVRGARLKFTIVCSQPVIFTSDNTVRKTIFLTLPSKGAVSFMQPLCGHRLWITRNWSFPAILVKCNRSDTRFFIGFMLSELVVEQRFHFANQNYFARSVSSNCIDLDSWLDSWPINIYQVYNAGSN